MRGTHRPSHLQKALKGCAVSLPMPLEKSIDHVTETLPNMDNTMIVVDSIPTKKNIIYENLVDFKKVFISEQR